MSFLLGYQLDRIHIDVLVISQLQLVCFHHFLLDCQLDHIHMDSLVISRFLDIIESPRLFPIVLCSLPAYVCCPCSWKVAHVSCLDWNHLTSDADKQMLIRTQIESVAGVSLEEL